MKVGFTGPRGGMNLKQSEVLQMQLHILGCTEFHHGDCRGADAQAHLIATAMGIRTVGHPPTASGFRAFCVCTELREPQPFLSRNRAIVHETSILIGTPDAPPYRRSGTWSTLNYADSLKLPFLIITLDGVITHGQFN